MISFCAQSVRFGVYRGSILWSRVIGVDIEVERSKIGVRVVSNGESPVRGLVQCSVF